MLGAILGSLTCFSIADEIGRKRTLIFSSMMFMVGSALEAFSGNPDWSARAGITVLIFGRLTYG